MIKYWRADFPRSWHIWIGRGIVRVVCRRRRIPSRPAWNG